MIICKKTNFRVVAKYTSYGISPTISSLSSTIYKLGNFWRCLTSHWKRPCCWERLKAGREGDDRGWDGWMASPTQWTWVWASSGSWWWTRKPGLLQSMVSQRVRHDWATELNWGKLLWASVFSSLKWKCCWT